MPTRLCKKKVSSKNSNTCIETTVHSVDTSTGRGFIHHIVVNQRRCMNHLGDFGQTTMAGRQFPVSGESSRNQ